MPAQWFYQMMGQVVGPVSADDLRKLARERTILRDTLIRKGEDGIWVTADKVRGLLDSVNEELRTAKTNQPPTPEAPARAVEKVGKQKMPSARSRDLRLGAGIGAVVFLGLVTWVVVTQSPSKPVFQNPPATPISQEIPPSAPSTGPAPTTAIAGSAKTDESRVDSFRDFASGFVHTLQNSCKLQKKTIGPQQFVAWVEVSDDYDIDVRKSESLMSPYVGELRIKTRTAFENPEGYGWLALGGDRNEWKIKKMLFDYKNGNWKLIE